MTSDTSPPSAGTPEPLPCPFCGEPPKTRQADGWCERPDLVRCSNGHCVAGHNYVELDRWNRRAVSVPEPRAVSAELRQAVNEYASAYEEPYSNDRNRRMEAALDRIAALSSPPQGRTDLSIPTYTYYEMECAIRDCAEQMRNGNDPDQVWLVTLEAHAISMLQDAVYLRDALTAPQGREPEDSIRALALPDESKAELLAFAHHMRSHRAGAAPDCRFCAEKHPNRHSEQPPQAPQGRGDVSTNAVRWIEEVACSLAARVRECGDTVPPEYIKRAAYAAEVLAALRPAPSSPETP